MIFSILDEVEKIYKDYSWNVGFEIIIRFPHRYSRSNEPSSRLFICRKGGRLGMTLLNLEDHGKRKRFRDVIPSTKCNARMCVVHKVKINQTGS